MSDRRGGDEVLAECGPHDWSPDCNGLIVNEENVKKGLCEACREEIRSWGEDEDRGIERESSKEQTTLLTDGGVDHSGGVPVRREFECDCGATIEIDGRDGATVPRLGYHWREQCPDPPKAYRPHDTGTEQSKHF